MSRGMWLCRRTENRERGWWHAPNSEAAVRGFPMPATQGCGFWNVYVRRRPMHRGWMNEKVDTRCRHCGRRVRFQPARQSGRGRPRPVYYEGRVEDTPLDELIQEVNLRNRGEQSTRDSLGFVRAKDYRKEDYEK